MYTIRSLALLGAALLLLPACDAVDPSGGDLGLAAAPTSDARGGQAKVDVCHSASGSFHMISVAARAVDAHRRHGDALPDEAVPGMDGFAFDEACAPVAVVTIPACLQGLFADAEADGLDTASFAPWTLSYDSDWGNGRGQVRLFSSSTGLTLDVNTLYGDAQCYLYGNSVSYGNSTDGTGDENLLDYVRGLAE